MNVTLFRKTTEDKLLYCAWAISLAATLGSLYFSEVLDLPPCSLCWYQRTMHYPLMIILTIALLRKDKNIPYYALPLTIIGLLIAVWHNLLYYRLIPESAAPCSLGISCTTKQIEWFGFITIPLLSLMAFILLALCFITILKRRSHEH